MVLLCQGFAVMTVTLENGGVPAGSQDAAVVDAGAGVSGAAAVEAMVADDAGEVGSVDDLDKLLNGEPDATDTTDTTDGSGAADDAGAADDGDGSDGDGGSEDQDADEDDGKHADLPKGVQKRIDRLTRLRRDAEELAAAEKQRAADAEQRAAEAESRFAQLQNGAAAAAGVSPLLAAKDAADLEVQRQRLWSLKKVLGEHADGYESEDGSFSLSAEEVRAKLQTVEYELFDTYPRAREALAARQASEQAAQAVYPELFAKGSAEARTFESLVAVVPGIVQLPQARMIVGDMLAGERIRELGLRVSADGKVVDADGKLVFGKGAAATAAPAKPAPKAVPRGASPPANAAAVPPATANGGNGQDRFKKVAELGTAAALEEALLSV